MELFTVLYKYKKEDLFSLLVTHQGTFGCVTVSKPDQQTYTSEFESHWAPHSFGLVPHRSKELRKLLLVTHHV